MIGIAMDLALPAEDLAWKDRARAFAETVLFPQELPLEMAGSLPRASGGGARDDRIDEVAVAQDRRPVGDLPNLVDVVADEYHARARFRQSRRAERGAAAGSHF